MVLAVEADGLGKIFRRRWALEGIDLEVSTGDCLAVLGHNGSGKTTLLRLLAGVLTPDAGRLSVMGYDAVAEPARLRGSVGVHMGEDRSWYWRLSGRENLEFFATVSGVSGMRRHRVDELLRLVGLAEAAERRVGEYSSGMRARLGLARSQLGTSPLLVLDEPTRSLDAQGSAELGEVLRKLKAESATTVVLATHDVDQAAALADQVVILDAGRVAARPPARPTSEQLAGLLGVARP